MKRNALAVVAALAAASLACNLNFNFNIPQVKTGPTETLAINEPAPPAGAGVMAVTIEMGAGKLDIQGGAAGLAEGEVRYNVAEWKPTVTRDSKSLTLTKGKANDTIRLPGQGNAIVNDWALKLGSTPMALTVNAGAYKGTLALGGLPLRSLTIHDGASNSKVTFDSANPEKMDSLTYETGASTVSLTGLANANAQTIDFTGGAGDYELDFSGKLLQDLTVSVKAGVSSIRLIVPAGIAATVNVTGGLNNVNTDGNWTHTGDIYNQTGEGHSLTIQVDMGVGSLKLVNK